MNSHLPEVLREALNGSFRLPQPQIVRIGAKSEVRESANDGEPAYIRMPELDRRVASGDEWNANAWHQTATGVTVYFSVLYEPNQKRWLPLVERSAVTR